MKAKKQETRWYHLWFVTAAMWLITFCGNFAAGQRDWVVWLQLCNIFVSLGAGFVNRIRYIRRHSDP